MEGAAGRPIVGVRHRAAIGVQPLSRLASACAESSAAAPGCTGAAGRGRSASTGACSTTRPRYITTTSSAISAITPRSWVMSMIAIPSSRWSWRSSSRICACVVTSSAVVGSSAISSVGIAGQRHRDHRPLAQAAAQLVGELVDALLRRGMPTRRSISIALLARLAPVDLLVEQDRLDDLVAHRVHGAERGHRLLEDRARSPPPRIARISALFGLELRQVDHRPARAGAAGRRNRISPLDDPARPVDDPQDRARGDALAAAALAHDAERRRG